MGKFIDLTGQRFGRLVVVKRVENKGKSVAWECICDCGNKKIVTSIGLTRGHTKSCGCFGAENLDKIHKQHTTHNQSFSKLYRIWCVMKQRCNNPNAQHYSTYGGRGIKVCDEWQEFEPFRDWALANGYDENAERGQCTLDRIDANRNYCPENCRWVDMKSQGNNRRTNRLITAYGETLNVTQWAEKTGIKRSAIYYRLQHGWDAIEAITRKVGDT